MNIQVASVPQQNLLGGPENMVTELKTSVFIAPGESVPGVKQYFQIAKTIAGFINGAGVVIIVAAKNSFKKCHGISSYVHSSSRSRISLIRRISSIAVGLKS